MLSLKQELEHSIQIQDQEYEIDLSFDNVLRWYELLEDESLTSIEIIDTAFDMFVIDSNESFDIDTKFKIVESISNYISGNNDENSDSSADQESMPKSLYNYDEDAGYIYASFMQEYGIDLDNVRGSLHWDKFFALLNGLRDNTKFREVIRIRAMPLPTGNDPEDIKERERILELKEIYALKSGDASLEAQEQRASEIFDSFFRNAKGDDK